MSIREEARQEAERRWPSPNTGLYEGLIIGFEKGAVWASEQADREPSDAEVLEASLTFERVWDEIIDSFDPERDDGITYIQAAMRAALLAAQEVRRG